MCFYFDRKRWSSCTLYLVVVMFMLKFILQPLRIALTAPQFYCSHFPFVFTSKKCFIVCRKVYFFASKGRWFLLQLASDALDLKFDKNLRKKTFICFDFCFIKVFYSYFLIYFLSIFWLVKINAL